MINEMEELYEVEDGVDDVTANDHNTVVQATQFLYRNLGSFLNFRNGSDGHMKLGVITATTTSAPTVTGTLTGNVTGTYYYKVSAYNMSGETAASTASSAITVTNKKVKVVIPPTGNNTNITGFYIYRSTDNTTFYRVGQLPVEAAASGGTFHDNLSLTLTSGTAPSGSNTSSASGSISGTYFAKSFTLASGQSLTITASVMGLRIISQGDILLGSGSTITGTGAGVQGLKVLAATYAQSGYTLSQNAYNAGGGYPVFDTDYIVHAAFVDYYNRQGSAYGSISGQSGIGMLFISNTKISVNGTIANNGTAGSVSGNIGGGGGAGGSVGFIAPEIDKSGGVISANGGAGGSSVGSSYYGGGGGGGGTVAFFANYATGTPTVTVNGGAFGSPGGNTAGGGCGGGNGGAGGGNASAGGVGRIVSATLSQVQLR